MPPVKRLLANSTGFVTTDRNVFCTNFEELFERRHGVSQRVIRVSAQTSQSEKVSEVRCMV